MPHNPDNNPGCCILVCLLSDIWNIITNFAAENRKQ